MDEVNTGSAIVNGSGVSAVETSGGYENKAVLVGEDLKGEVTLPEAMKSMETSFSAFTEVATAFVDGHNKTVLKNSKSIESLSAAVETIEENTSSFCTEDDVDEKISEVDHEDRISDLEYQVSDLSGIEDKVEDIDDWDKRISDVESECSKVEEFESRLSTVEMSSVEDLESRLSELEEKVSKNAAFIARLQKSTDLALTYWHTS